VAVYGLSALRESSWIPPTAFFPLAIYFSFCSACLGFSPNRCSDRFIFIIGMARGSTMFRGTNEVRLYMLRRCLPTRSKCEIVPYSLKLRLLGYGLCGSTASKSTHSDHPTIWDHSLAPTSQAARMPDLSGQVTVSMFHLHS
jgi:hypothetical protein